MDTTTRNPTIAERAESGVTDAAPGGGVPGLASGAPSGHGDRALVARALRARGAGDDPRALEDIVVRYRPLVLAAISRTCSDASTTEDLVQECFLRAWRKLPEFAFRSSLATWLYTIARNVATDENRRAHRYHETATSVDVLDRRPASEPVEATETAAIDPARLRTAIARLSGPEREILSLREISELSYLEIAARTGLPIGTVESRLFRVRRKLREWVRHDG